MKTRRDGALESPPVGSLRLRALFQCFQASVSRNRFGLCMSVCALLFLLGSSPAAQLATKTHRLGVLEPGDSTNVCNDGLRQGLRALGYVENENLVIEARYAQWKPDDCSNLLRSWLSLILTRSELMDQPPFVLSNGLHRQFRSLLGFRAIW